MNVKKKAKIKSQTVDWGRIVLTDAKHFFLMLGLWIFSGFHVLSSVVT